MNRYFIVKSGWEMFDLSRAYGLGIVLYALEPSDVLLSDRNYWYEISILSEPSLGVEQISGYLGEDLDWSKVLVTTTRTRQRAIIKEIKEFLSDKSKVKQILERYSSFESSQIPYSGENSRTLYGSMEPRSFKGLREPIRLKVSYHEGKTPKVSLKDWILSILGHINITVWTYGLDFNELLLTMPTPTYDGVKISHLHIDIRDDIKRDIKRMHFAGRFPTLAYIGMRLVKTKLEEKEGLVFSPSYKSLLYGSMVRTGQRKSQQWKPTISGIFPLDFINSIAQSPKNIEILRIWEHIFRKTNRKGCEDLAVALSDFIADPILTNFTKYLNLHTRQSLNKKIGLHLYNGAVMKEVVQYVSA